MSAPSFVEDRVAKHEHTCTQCSECIGSGDTYIREAIPPWAFRYRDEFGMLVDVGEDLWIVIKKCYNCIGGYPIAI